MLDWYYILGGLVVVALIGWSYWILGYRLFIATHKRVCFTHSILMTLSNLEYTNPHINPIMKQLKWIDNTVLGHAVRLTIKYYFEWDDYEIEIYTSFGQYITRRTSNRCTIFKCIYLLNRKGIDFKVKPRM